MNAPVAWARSLGTVAVSFGCGDVAAQHIEADSRDYAWNRRRTAEFVGVGLCVLIGAAS